MSSYEVESPLDVDVSFVKPLKRRLVLTQERTAEALPSIDGLLGRQASQLETGPVSVSVPRSRGSRISQSVVLERELGRGAMGVVWLARHETLGIPVAVKFFDGLVGDAPNQRFRVEGMVLARVSSLSRDIVRVLDAGVQDDTQFIVMEYIDGPSLETLLERGPVRHANASSVIDRLATAIDQLHQAGYVHRDVKPANVLVTADFATVKLADFGIVKVLDPQQFGVRATTTAMVLGTPAYLSPEQLAGDVPSAKQDVWALAVTAYELVAGRLPFEAPTFIGLAAAICSAQFLKPTEVGLPDSLDAVFEHAFAVEVESRFPSATAFAGAFRAALESAGKDLEESRAIRQPPATPPWLPTPRGARSYAEIERLTSPAPASPKRGWAPIALVIASLVIAAGALLSVTLSRHLTPREPRRATSIILATQTAIPSEPTHDGPPSAEIAFAPAEKLWVEQSTAAEASAPSETDASAKSASANASPVESAQKSRPADKSEVF